MVNSVLAGSVCFIACHGGPADHFGTFAQELSQKGISAQLYASGPALKKLQDRHIDATAFDPKDVAKVIEACSAAKAVFVDVGNQTCVDIMKQLSDRHIHRIAYYDNPEPFVKGYTETAIEVMKLADTVLFANSNLKEVFSPSFEGKRMIGLGYYPVGQAERIEKRRLSGERKEARDAFFQEHGLKDTGQKIVVYFGGNNDEYFRLFPKVFSMLEKEPEASNILFVLQQHPGAKAANKDGAAVEVWVREHQNAPAFVVSKGTSDTAQIFADEAWYHQTSMGPQFALEGLPTAQVPGPFEDILVRSGCAKSISTQEQFHEAVLRVREGRYEAIDKADLLAKLGIRSDWAQVLESVCAPAAE